MEIGVLIGSAHFVLEDEGCQIPEGEQERFDMLPAEYSHLFLAVGGQLAGRPVYLRSAAGGGCIGTCRLAGDGDLENRNADGEDSRRTAAVIAEQLNVDEFRLRFCLRTRQSLWHSSESRAIRL